MKVCHLTSAHPSDDIRIFHKECVSLANYGLDVYLIAADGKSRIENGVKVLSIEKSTGGRLKRMFKTTHSVYQKALELDADIYHFHDPELLPYGMKLRKKGKKVIYDVHEDVPKQIMDKHWIPNVFRGLISWIFKKYEMYCAKRMSGIISVTPMICARFSNVNKQVAMVANYPLIQEGEQMMNSVIDKKSNQICYVGGLFPSRGVKELVEAMEMTDATLELAGNFSPVEFEQEVRALKGWSKVNYLGHVDRQKIMAILESSIAGIVTLHPTRSYVEALPIKLFEYMSAGIPVIASDFPMWRAIVDESTCGICVDPLKPERIAEAINSLVSNPVIAREMGVNGRKVFFEKYNWGAQEKKLFEFYRSI